MTPRSQSVLSFSALTTLLLGVALVLANVVIARAATSVDLTEERLYSITDGTKKILAGMKDPATIRVFWGGLQATQEPLRRTFAALLDEMADASDGKLTVRWVDVSDKEGVGEAEAAKVPKFAFFVPVGDEMRQTEGYSSLIIESGSRDPKLLNGLINHASDFEYVVATALVAATRKGDQVLALIDGSDRHGGMMMGGRGGRFEALKEGLRDRYGDSVQWWHTLDQPLADNISVLLLLAPRGLKDEQVFHFEQFLLRGGKAVVCLDPLDLDTVLGNERGESETSGLEPWLENLGVTVGRGTAVEGDPDLWLLYLVRKERGVVRTKSGYWFRVLRENCDVSNPAFATLGSNFTFSTYWPAPFSFDRAFQESAGRKVTVLMSTSPEGMRSDDMMAVREGETPTGLPREKVPLALLVEGPADSLWKGKPAPGEDKPKDDGPSFPLPGPIPGTVPPRTPEPPAPAEGAKPPEPPKEPAPETPKEPAPSTPPEPPKEPAPKEPPAPPPGEPQGPRGPEGEPPVSGPVGAPGDEPPGSPPPAEPAQPAEPPKEPAKPAEPPKEPAKPAEPPTPVPAESPSGLRPGGPGAGPVPAPAPGEPTPGDKPAEPPAPAGPKHLQSGPVRFVVVGDADMLTDTLGTRSQATVALGLGHGGMVVVANTVDWLMGDDALLGLRAKDTKARAIERPDDAKRMLLQTLNMAGIPVLAAFAGLVVFLRRRSQR